MARPLINLVVTQGSGGAPADQAGAAPSPESPQAAQPAGVAPHPDSAHADRDTQAAQTNAPAALSTQASGTTRQARPLRPTAPKPAAQHSIYSAASSGQAPPAPPPNGVAPHPDSLHTGDTTAPPAPLTPPPPPPPPTLDSVVWQLGNDNVWRSVAGPMPGADAQAIAQSEQNVTGLLTEVLPYGQQP